MTVALMLLLVAVAAAAAKRAVLDTGDGVGGSSSIRTVVGGAAPAAVLLFKEVDSIEVSRYHAAMEFLAAATDDGVVLAQVDWLRNPKTREALRTALPPAADPAAIAFFPAGATVPAAVYAERGEQVTGPAVRDWLRTQQLLQQQPKPATVGLAEDAPPANQLRGGKSKQLRGGDPNLKLSGLAWWQLALLLLFACTGIGAVVFFLQSATPHPHHRRYRQHYN